LTTPTIPIPEVLARAASLDIAGAADMAAVAKYPNRNIQLRQGALIIRRNDGEPKPEPPRDPSPKSLSVKALYVGAERLIAVIAARAQGVDDEDAGILCRQ
jgi:hypothetical protein